MAVQRDVHPMEKILANIALSYGAITVHLSVNAMTNVDHLGREKDFAKKIQKNGFQHLDFEAFYL